MRTNQELKGNLIRIVVSATATRTTSALEVAFFLALFNQLLIRQLFSPSPFIATPSVGTGVPVGTATGINTQDIINGQGSQLNNAGNNRQNLVNAIGSQVNAGFGNNNQNVAFGTGNQLNAGVGTSNQNIFGGLGNQVNTGAGNNNQNCVNGFCTQVNNG